MLSRQARRKSRQLRKYEFIRMTLRNLIRWRRICRISKNLFLIQEWMFSVRILKLIIRYLRRWKRIIRIGRSLIVNSQWMVLHQVMWQERGRIRIDCRTRFRIPLKISRWIKMLLRLLLRFACGLMSQFSIISRNARTKNYLIPFLLNLREMQFSLNPLLKNSFSPNS